MSLKIVKFVNKDLKIYIQVYNHVLKKQFLFLKYGDVQKKLRIWTLFT